MIAKNCNHKGFSEFADSTEILSSVDAANHARRVTPGTLEAPLQLADPLNQGAIPRIHQRIVLVDRHG
jgi:hypothetical protein